MENRNDSRVYNPTKSGEYKGLTDSFSPASDSSLSTISTPGQWRQLWDMRLQKDQHRLEFSIWNAPNTWNHQQLITKIYGNTMRSVEAVFLQTRSFFVMMHDIKSIPSMHSQFVEMIAKATGYQLLTINMLLTTSTKGFTPSLAQRMRIAKALKISEVSLFPNDRLQVGSLVSLYKFFKTQPSAYTILIEMLASAACVSDKTLKYWIKTKRIPQQKAKLIADCIGIPYVKLFPNPSQYGNDHSSPGKAV